MDAGTEKQDREKEADTVMTKARFFVLSSQALLDCKNGTKVSCSTLLFMIFASQTLLYTVCSALDPRYKY